MSSRAFVIAEAGVNHNGDPELAKRLVEAAAECGAYAVKFQTFRAERLVGKGVPKADHQLGSAAAHESQFDVLKRPELPGAFHHELKR